MNNEDSKIETRLADVLNSIPCPVAGCWPLHGGHTEYYFDLDAESHVLEVWPVGIEEPEEHEGSRKPLARSGHALLSALVEWNNRGYHHLDYASRGGRKHPRESDRFCGGLPRRNRNKRD